MHRKFKIYISDSFDPCFNLSVENWMMECGSLNQTSMFLWQNKNTVVIGRNQNPLKECDLKMLAADDVRLVRRMSGGGAVYHDLGNMNFTFIVPDAYYNIEDNISIILNALLRFGIKGSFNGRNDLVVNGSKFSGNAFVSDNGMNCHHGTLLVSTDIGRLSRYLTVSPLKLESKGIDSVKSRVVNLKEISPEISIISLKHALISSFNEFYRTDAEMAWINEKSLDLTSYMGKYSSDDWNYSETPEFSVSIEEKFDWGIAEVCIEVIDGTVKACRIYTDAISVNGFHELEKNLLGKRFDKENILNSLRSIGCNLK